MRIKILPNDKGNPAGKLADAELIFEDGPLAGLRLIGFGIWERRTGTGRNVTFPARQYSVNGERRSFALLRPVSDSDAQNGIRDRVLEAYAEFEAGGADVAISVPAEGPREVGIAMSAPVNDAAGPGAVAASYRLQAFASGPGGGGLF